MPSGIYRATGIVGDVGTELSPDRYHQWGLALGAKLSGGAKFIAGGDNRASTAEFLPALIDGLCQTGVQVVDLGTLPAPMIDYARRRLGADASAVVTGLYHGPQRNGLIWTFADPALGPADAEALDTAAEQAEPAGTTPSESRTLDISFDYVASLQEMWVEGLSTTGQVVLDPMFGPWAGKARRYLHAIFPQVIFSSIRDTAEPDLGGTAPNCQQETMLADLTDVVYLERAGVGLALGGSGERLAVVDGDGLILSNEEIAWLVLEARRDRLAGQRVVCEWTLPDHLLDVATELGAEAVRHVGGREPMVAEMLASGAALGIDAEGHCFFPELGGECDALFTACVLIEFQGRSESTLADLRSAFPQFLASAELRVDMPIEKHAALLDRLSTAMADHPQERFDGLRIRTPAGSVTVRPVPAQPSVALRFESSDRYAMDDLVRRTSDALPESGVDVWLRYEQSIVER